MISYVIPRWEGAMRWRLTLLELAEREVWFEEEVCVEGVSFCAACLARCAASSFATYFEFARYEGVKNGGVVFMDGDDDEGPPWRGVCGVMV